MATLAPISGCAPSAPGKFEDFSTLASRRAVLGAVAGAALIGLPGLALADDGAWQAARAAYESALQRANDHFAARKPIERLEPARPSLVVRVGTHRDTGEPLMHKFEEWEMDRIEGVLAHNPGFLEARDRWQAFRAAHDAWERETGYPALEKQGDALASATWDAAEALVLTPAPNLGALAYKLEIVLHDDHFGMIEDDEISGQLLADTRRLIRAGFQ